MQCNYCHVSVLKLISAPQNLMKLHLCGRVGQRTQKYSFECLHAFILSRLNHKLHMVFNLFTFLCSCDWFFHQLVLALFISFLLRSFVLPFPSTFSQGRLGIETSKSLDRSVLMYMTRNTMEKGTQWFGATLHVCAKLATFIREFSLL